MISILDIDGLLDLDDNALSTNIAKKKLFIYLYVFSGVNSFLSLNNVAFYRNFTKQNIHLELDDNTLKSLFDNNYIRKINEFNAYYVDQYALSHFVKSRLVKINFVNIRRDIIEQYIEWYKKYSADVKRLEYNNLKRYMEEYYKNN